MRARRPGRFRLEDEDVRAAREDEEQGLRVVEGSAGSERALRVPDGPGRVALGRAHLGTDRVDLEGAVVRRSCLDLGDELICGPQRLVPLAAAVAVVDQHALEPAAIARGADPLGRSRSPSSAPRSRRRGHRASAGRRPSVVAAGQARQMPRRRSATSMLCSTSSSPDGSPRFSRVSPSRPRASLRPASQPSCSARARVCVTISSAR